MDLYQFQTLTLTFWSNDFHIAPVADIKHLLAGFGIGVRDKSLSNHCELTSSCQNDLRVLTKDNGISLGHCPECLRRDFYNAYKDDVDFISVDAILCLHAARLNKFQFCKLTLFP